MTIGTLLLEPQEGGNLGSICRGLKTLGFSPPGLVSGPEGLERSPDARRLAHGAREYLDQVQRFDTLDEALEGYDFIVGTTARRRRSVLEYINLRALPPLLTGKGASVSRVAILFGSEASGLPSDVLRRCHLVSTVPLKTTYPSLNLAQAVLIYAYELAPLIHESEEPKYSSTEQTSGPEYRALLERVEKLLSERRVNEALLGRVKERLAHVEGGDVALIHSILNALER
mgnify:CR=1 FL=1